MTVHSDRYEEVRLLLEKQEIKIKADDKRDGFSAISLENCIFDDNHKQATIVFHPTGQVSYVCHTLSCQGRTWDQVLAKLEGKSLESSNTPILENQKQNAISAAIFMKISDLKENPLNKKILPILTQDQRECLKRRIQEYGFREPVEITPENSILDGHNRIKICQELGILKVPAIIINIPLEEQEIYIIQKNFSRRQLTPEQQSILRGKIYQHEKKKIGAPHGNQNAAQNNVAIFTTLNSEEDSARTAHNLAEKFHVSERTIRNDAQFAESIDTIHENSPELEQKILSREKINGQNLTKKKVIKIAKRIEDKKANQEPIPTSEEEILKLVDEEETPKAIPEKTPHEENPLETSKPCKTSLLVLLEEILDRIQRVRGHKDFPHEVMEKLNHIEEEFTAIVRIVSTKGKGLLKSEI